MNLYDLGGTSMIERQWVCGKNPKEMLAFVQDKSSNRRLRLFVCGYLRSYLHRYDDELSRRALEISERFADGLATTVEVEACRKEARIAVRQGNEAAWLAVDAAFLNTSRALQRVFGDLTTAADRRTKVHLLHDLWGPLPFRSVAIGSSWLTPSVFELAKLIYNEGAFDRLPDLADALENTGCDDACILCHCREEGPHVRGCWLIDLILGKT